MNSLVEKLERSVWVGFVVAMMNLLCCFSSLAQTEPIRSNQAIYQTLYTVPDSLNQEPECTLSETAPGVFVGFFDFDGTVYTQIFQVTSNAAFAQLVQLDPATLGSWTRGKLLTASNGLIYGTTMGYGPNPNEWGTVFRTTDKGQASLVSSDIGYSSPVIEGRDGKLYGTGFISSSSYGLYRISLSGQLEAFYPFPGSFSAVNLVPTGPVLEASDGNFYGELYTNSTGIVYKITPQGAYTQLYQQSEFYMMGGLIEAPNGILYGADEESIFSITKSGQYKVLHEFNGYTGFPQAGLTLADDGKIYGSTTWSQFVGDGPPGIYRIAPDGSGYGMVYSFGDQFDGIYSLGSSVIQGTDGKLYGASANGINNQIFSLDLGLSPPLPRAVSFRPSRGSPGTVVLISGRHLLGATEVSFNGTPAIHFGNEGTNYVTATVPSGATSGPITITTINGTSTTTRSFIVQ